LLSSVTERRKGVEMTTTYWNQSRSRERSRGWSGRSREGRGPSTDPFDAIVSFAGAVAWTVALFWVLMATPSSGRGVTTNQAAAPGGALAQAVGAVTD
jgi:hypothetical protein